MLSCKKIFLASKCQKWSRYPQSREMPSSDLFSVDSSSQSYFAKKRDKSCLTHDQNMRGSKSCCLFTMESRIGDFVFTKKIWLNHDKSKNVLNGNGTTLLLKSCKRCEGMKNESISCSFHLYTFPLFMRFHPFGSIGILKLFKPRFYRRVKSNLT